jgi:ribose transport system permease protein
MTVQNVRASRKSHQNSDPEQSVASRRNRVLTALEEYGLFLLLAAVVVVFSMLPATSDLFLTSANARTLLGNQSVLAVLALASIIPLIAGQFDLSVAAVLGVSSMVLAAITTDAGQPLWVGILAAIAFGLLVGLINGYLVAVVGVNSLIGTLGVSTALLGLATAYSANPINHVPISLTLFGSSLTAGLPTMFFVLIAFSALCYFVLDYTPYGRQLTATGSNAASARLVGIRVPRVQMRCFLWSGGLAAAAGVLQASRSGVGDANVGAGFLLPALAAAFLGSTAIRPGHFNVLGTIVAIFFVATSVNGLTLAGIDPWVQDVFNGVALIAGVSFSAIMRRHRSGGEPV